MKPAIIILPGNQYLEKVLPEQLDFDQVNIIVKDFPDGESYVRIQTPMTERTVFIVESLDRPNSKLLPLLFLSSQLKEMGASKLVLVTPYLPYMRQDKEFNKGECVTSIHFSQLLSRYFDHLITVDPHLHRHQSLEDLYAMSSQCLHSAPLLTEWIRTQITRPLILGPDSESKQWVKEIATLADAPFKVLSKQRIGDKKVTLKELNLLEFVNHTPVLVDDIISTAGTMCASVNLLKQQITNAPVCIGIHAIFADDAFQRLMITGVAEVVTTNSISHESNGIDIMPLLVSAIQRYLQT